MDTASYPTPDAEIAALRSLLAERDAALAERDALLLNSRLEIDKLKVQLVLPWNLSPEAQAVAVG